MKRALGFVLLLLLCALLLDLGVTWLADSWLGTRTPTHAQGPAASTGPVDALIEQTLSPAVPTEEEPEPRSDADGRWEVRALRVKLPPGQSASERAQGLARALNELGQGVSAYASDEGPWTSVVRVYGGKRLTHRLSVEALAGEASPTPTVPWLALVFTGLGDDLGDARALLDARVPLTLAVRPYTPYALRICQDALRRHKEVMVELAPGESPEDALKALLYPTGLLLLEAPTQLPTALLLREGLFLGLDPTLVGSAALREGVREGVRTLKVQALSGGSPEEQMRRAAGLASSSGVVALRAPSNEPETSAALLQLLQGGAVRPVFATEALDRISR